ncbi:MAG TPA: MFS transporter [Candidatus Binatia bacterium]|jgi:FSR family fosmidomycin resistance protein-like MFS transporter
MTLGAAESTASVSREGTLGRSTIFGIVCGAHFINHFQSAMLGVIYPLMMKELGLGFAAIASIAAAYNTLGNVLQGVYGFIVPHVRRGVILGVGNCLLGLSVIASGFASSYQHFFTTRLLGGVGASPQHPVGSSILASHFGGARGRALAFHSTAGQIGGLFAPLLGAYLILYIGWRGLFWGVGALATIMGLICFIFRDSLRRARTDEPRSRLTPLGWEAYKKCLKNKNILLVSLVFMVGAAGRGQDINETYIIPHFVRDFGLSLTYGAFLFMFIQVGSLCGPYIWGWLSDRYNRKLVIQASLVVSAVSSFWLGWQGEVSSSLYANLVMYGAAVTSRQTLTQALLSDLVGDDLFDAAFSLYYFIGFLSIPFWTLVTGGIMEHYGFGPAFSLISTSYLAASLLLLFLRHPARTAAAGVTLK